MKLDKLAILCKDKNEFTKVQEIAFKENIFWGIAGSPVFQDHNSFPYFITIESRPSSGNRISYMRMGSATDKYVKGYITLNGLTELEFKDFYKLSSKSYQLEFDF